jgi:hypothetical protein
MDAFSVSAAGILLSMSLPKEHWWTRHQWHPAVAPKSLNHCNLSTSQKNGATQVRGGIQRSCQSGDSSYVDAAMRLLDLTEDQFV